MENLLTVSETSKMLQLAPDTVRRGILQGKLPGVAVASESRQNFIIPRKAVELFLLTGMTPAMLAQSVMQTETIEQSIAYLKVVLAGNTP